MGFLDAPPIVVPRPVLFESVGHSYAQGVGAWDDNAGYGMRTGRLLGAQRVIDRGYAGSVCCHANNSGTGDGGWAWLLNTLGPPTLEPQVPWVAPGKFGARHCVVSYEHALNDLGWLGMNTLPLIEAHRAVLSRLCATRVYPYNTSGVFTGTWTTSSFKAEQALGNGAKETKTTGSYVSLTVDSDAPSGLVFAVGLVVLPEDNFVAKVYRNGTLVKTWTVKGSTMCDPGYTGTFKGNTAVLRLTEGVKAEDVIKVELSTWTAGALRYNYSNLETAPENGPVIAIPLPSHLPEGGYEFYAKAAYAKGSEMGGAVIDNAKVALKELASEFPGRVLTVDYDAAGIINTAAYPHGTFYEDNLHPSDDSHGERAAVLARAILQSGLLKPHQAAMFSAPVKPMYYSLGGGAAWGAASLLGKGFLNSWTHYDALNNTYTDTYPGFYKDETGHVRFRGKLKGGESGKPFVTMPRGYGSTINRSFTVPVGVDEVQKLTVTATGGTFVLVNGSTKATLKFNATAAEVQKALGENNVGIANVTCSGTLAAGMTITFTGSGSGLPQTLMTVETGGLTGGTATVTRETAGATTTGTVLVEGSPGTSSLTPIFTGTIAWIDIGSVTYESDV
jgi:hypothetical protein